MRQILSVAGRVRFKNRINDKSVLYSKQEKQFVLIEVILSRQTVFCCKGKVSFKNPRFQKSVAFRRKLEDVWLTVKFDFRIIFIRYQ